MTDEKLERLETAIHAMTGVFDDLEDELGRLQQTVTDLRDRYEKLAGMLFDEIYGE